MYSIELSYEDQYGNRKTSNLKMKAIGFIDAVERTNQILPFLGLSIISLSIECED